MNILEPVTIPELFIAKVVKDTLDLQSLIPTMNQVIIPVTMLLNLIILTHLLNIIPTSPLITFMLSLITRDLAVASHFPRDLGAISKMPCFSLIHFFNACNIISISKYLYHP